MAYLVLRALSHPSLAIGKNSEGGNFIYTREFSRKELISQRLLGGFAGRRRTPQNLSLPS